MLKGLESISYEERLRILGLSSLKGGMEECTNVCLFVFNLKHQKYQKYITHSLSISEEMLVKYGISEGEKRLLCQASCLLMKYCNIRLAKK